MKDIAPNLATVVMGLKDKIAQKNEYTAVWNNPEWANGQDIATFFNNKIDSYKKDIKYAEQNGADRDFNKEFDIRKFEKARNVVNAIRLNGPTAFIRQSERYWAADAVADITVGKKFDEKGNYDEAKAKEHDRVTTLLAASLGHKNSIKELKRQSQQQ